MAEVSIAYMVPVQVIVNMDDGKVLRVVVVDEEIHQDREGHWEVLAGGRDDGLHARAYDVAEAADEWPRWEFGF